MVYKKVSIQEAKDDLSGMHCPDHTEMPCIPLGHTIRETKSGKVHARCSRCKRAYMLSGEYV